MLKKICEKVKRISSGTKIAFSNIIYRKDKQNIIYRKGKRNIAKHWHARIDTNSRLKNFCSQKNTSLIATQGKSIWVLKIAPE